MPPKELTQSKACDHALPICRRCIQRKTSASCVYLPAPMTQKSPREPVLKNNASIRNIEVQPIQLSLPVLNVGLTGLERTHSVDTPDSQSTNGHSQGSLAHSSPILTHAAGFLGPTSFTSVFSENQRNIEHALPIGKGLAGDDETEHFQSQARIDECLDARHIQLGMKVLAALPDWNTCLFFLARYSFSSDGWLRPAAKHLIDSTWSTFGAELKRGAQGIEAVARIMCRNSKSQLEEEDDAEAWLKSFSGQQMRWEALGLIFVVCTRGIMASPENDPIFVKANGQRKNYKCFLDEMREGVSLCVALCSSGDMVNTVMLVLMYQNCIVQSQLGANGDTSKVVRSSFLYLNSHRPRFLTLAPSWRPHRSLHCARYSSRCSMP
jgi:hypothetical protein